MKGYGSIHYEGEFESECPSSLSVPSRSRVCDYLTTAGLEGLSIAPMSHRSQTLVLVLSIMMSGVLVMSELHSISHSATDSTLIETFCGAGGELVGCKSSVWRQQTPVSLRAVVGGSSFGSAGGNSTNVAWDTGNELHTNDSAYMLLVDPTECRSARRLWQIKMADPYGHEIEMYGSTMARQHAVLLPSGFNTRSLRVDYRLWDPLMPVREQFAMIDRVSPDVSSMSASCDIRLTLLSKLPGSTGAQRLSDVFGASCDAASTYNALLSRGISTDSTAADVFGFSYASWFIVLFGLGSVLLNFLALLGHLHFADAVLIDSIVCSVGLQAVFVFFIARLSGSSGLHCQACFVDSTSCDSDSTPIAHTLRVLSVAMAIRLVVVQYMVTCRTWRDPCERENYFLTKGVLICLMLLPSTTGALFLLPNYVSDAVGSIVFVLLVFPVVIGWAAMFVIPLLTDVSGSVVLIHKSDIQLYRGM